MSVPPSYLNGPNTKFYQLAWPSRPHLTLLALSPALGLNNFSHFVSYLDLNIHSILGTLISLTYLYRVWLCSVTILLWNSTFCFFSCMREKNCLYNTRTTAQNAMGLSTHFAASSESLCKKNTDLISELFSWIQFVQLNYDLIITLMHSFCWFEWFSITIEYMVSVEAGNSPLLMEGTSTLYILFLDVRAIENLHSLWLEPSVRQTVIILN